MISDFSSPTPAQGYAMSKSTTATATTPAEKHPDSEVLEFRAGVESRSPLDEIVRQGAQRMLQAAIDAEVDEFIAQHSDRRDQQDRRLVVRNGRHPSRPILSGAVRLDVSQPRERKKDIVTICLGRISSYPPGHSRVESPKNAGIQVILYLKRPTTGCALLEVSDFGVEKHRKSTCDCPA